MTCKNSFLVGLVALLCAAGPARASYDEKNYCQERSRGDVRSLCAGRTLPYDQVRNKKNHELVCTSNVDNYVRFPQTQVSHEEWSGLISANQKQAAYDLKRKLPAIEWSGTIPYETVEEWDYEECERVTQSVPCGTHQVCENVEHDVPTYDTDGKQTGSKKVKEKVCNDEPNTCWTDVTHGASQFCSNESMKFSARYERPSTAEWNINSPNFMDVIPNKYDLLPGETEVVQVYNTSRRSTRLSPSVEIGDAWNKYDTSRITGTAVGATCRQNSNYSFDLTVRTIERDAGKASPNAFRFPVDWEGNAIEPIVWKSANDRRSGKTVDKAVPIKVQLDDTSAGIISLMAEQSRRNAEREATKVAVGKGANAKDRAEFQKIGKKTDGYWKSTKVRVKLYRQVKYWWDTFRGAEKVAEIDAISPTMNFLATNEEVKFSDLWAIPLTADGGNSDPKTFRGIFDSKHMKPNRAYTLEVSVYQPHVPFYKQSCDDNPKQSWRCKKFWRALGMGIGEDRYFSKPLKVPFRAPKEYDGRGWFKRSWISNAPDNFMTWIFGGDVKLDSEKGMGKKK